MGTGADGAAVADADTDTKAIGGSGAGVDVVGGNHTRLGVTGGVGAAEEVPEGTGVATDVPGGASTGGEGVDHEIRIVASAGTDVEALSCNVAGTDVLEDTCTAGVALGGVTTRGDTLGVSNASMASTSCLIRRVISFTFSISKA
jgi:hypothetical protein